MVHKGTQQLTCLGIIQDGRLERPPKQSHKRLRGDFGSRLPLFSKVGYRLGSAKVAQCADLSEAECGSKHYFKESTTCLGIAKGNCSLKIAYPRDFKKNLSDSVNKLLQKMTPGLKGRLLFLWVCSMQLYVTGKEM